jgi:hypothetical protein
MELPPGADANDSAAWKTARELRRAALIALPYPAPASRVETDRAAEPLRRPLRPVEARPVIPGRIEGRQPEGSRSR